MWGPLDRQALENIAHSSLIVVTISGPRVEYGFVTI